MSKQSVLAILVFAVLLGGVYLANQQPDEKGISRITFAAVDHEAIDSLIVEGPEPITLTKKDGQWLVDGKHRASKGAVTGALAAIPKIVSSELSTANAERFASYEVDADTGHKVTASSGGKIVAEFVVGKAAEAGTNLRVGDEVFLVKGVYAYSFARKRAQWFELRLFETKLEEVLRAELGPAEAPYALEKSGEAWGFAAEPATALRSAFRFDANAAKNRVSAFLNLRARELVMEDPGAEKTGLSDQSAKVSFTTADTRTVLLLGKSASEDGTAIYGRIEGSDALYLLHSSNVEALLSTAVKLRELNLMDLSPELVRTLEITQGKDRLLLEKRESGWEIAESHPPAPEGFEFDPARVAQRLAGLRSARALGLAEGETEGSAGLVKPAVTITATLEDGGEAVLKLGEERETEGQKWIPAMGNLDGEVYRLSVYVKNNLVGGIQTFRKVAAPSNPGGMAGFDPEMMKNLPPEVRQALMQKQLEQQQLQNLAAKLPPVAPPPKKKAE